MRDKWRACAREEDPAAQIAAHNGGKIGFARETLLARYSKIWGARNVETGVDHHQQIMIITGILCFGYTSES
jgi:hypothetical protein